MPEEHPDEEFEGFAIPLPAGLSQLLSRAHGHHEREHLQVESMQQRIYNFLDALPVDDLVTLRHIFNLDPKSPIANYFEGMCVTLLRVVHRVNPDTGASEDEFLKEAAARKGPPASA